MNAKQEAAIGYKSPKNSDFSYKSPKDCDYDPREFESPKDSEPYLPVLPASLAKKP
jgi:hypothetical protein